MNSKAPPLPFDISPLSARDIRIAEKEIAKALSSDSVPPSPDVDRISVEDLKKTGAIASDFMRGLDRISTVLMVLVLKFGRASNMMRAVLVGMAIGIILFGMALMASYGINSKLEQIIQTQETLIRKVDETAEQAADASKRADDARAQARVAEESAPKVVVDKVTGKPKLVVQSNKISGKKGDPVEIDLKLR